MLCLRTGRVCAAAVHTAGGIELSRRIGAVCAQRVATHAIVHGRRDDAAQAGCAWGQPSPSMLGVRAESNLVLQCGVFLRAPKKVQPRFMPVLLCATMRTVSLKVPPGPQQAVNHLVRNRLLCQVLKMPCHKHYNNHPAWMCRRIEQCATHVATQGPSRRSRAPTGLQWVPKCHGALEMPTSTTTCAWAQQVLSSTNLTFGHGGPKPPIVHQRAFPLCAGTAHGAYN